MRTLSHYFQMCKEHENTESNIFNVKKIYGIDKDKKIVEIKGFDEIFIETSDDEGFLIDFKSRNPYNKTAVSIRTWPSYQSFNDEADTFSRIVIKPSAANIIEINVDK